MVRPKKFLGQHFLKDQNIARKIVESLDVPEGHTVLEIGPGTGVLTRMLVEKKIDLWLSEIDRESIAYLKVNFPELSKTLLEGDVLDLDMDTVLPGQFSIIGNFPYNISSQIFFKVLDHRQHVQQVVCMLQREVAQRISAPEGSKTYGILSVLLQAYFDIEYLFKVPPGVFHPPPKVMSAVIRLRRNRVSSLDCDEQLFRAVVKQGFQNRRKTLRNALKNLNLPPSVYSLTVMDKRAEQLSVDQFISLTRKIEKSREGDLSI